MNMGLVYTAIAILLIAIPVHVAGVVLLQYFPLSSFSTTDKEDWARGIGLATAIIGDFMCCLGLYCVFSYWFPNIAFYFPIAVFVTYAGVFVVMAKLSKKP